MLTHTNIAGQAMTNLFTIGADINNDVGFIGVPLFHIAGIGNMISGAAARPADGASTRSARSTRARCSTCSRPRR